MHVIIDPSPTSEHPKAGADNGKKAFEEKPLPRFIRPEWVNVYITAIYVVIAGLTLWAIKKQADLIEASGAVAEQSAKAAEISAKAALRGMELAGKSFDVFKDSVEAAMVTAKATAISALASEESAKAANAQIKMMKNKERARIQVTPAKIDIVDADEPNNIGLEFLNIGPTSAFGVRVDAGGRITVTGLESEEGEYTDLAISSLLKPDTSDSSWVVCCFPIQWEDEVLYANAKIRIEVKGKVRYEDVFGDIHAEEFAFRMSVYGLSQMPSRKVKLKLMRDWHPFSPDEWVS